MGNFNSNNRGSGRRDSRGGSGRNYGERPSSGRTEMHSAVCDECGKDCKVPFRPSGDKPIYCSDCFEKRGGGSDRGSDRGPKDRGSRGHGQAPSINIGAITEKIDATNAKLDTLIRLLTPKKEPAKEVKAPKAKKTKSPAKAK